MKNNTPAQSRKTCEHCMYWDGTATSYLGICTHPETYVSRVAFDATCPAHTMKSVPAQSAQQNTPPETVPPAPASSGPVPTIGTRGRLAPQKPRSPRRLNP